LRLSGIARGRRLIPALGALLFFFVFMPVFLYSMPKDAVLFPVRSALAKQGIEFSCEEARFGFPLRLVCSNAVVVPRGGTPISLDSVEAAWEFTGLLEWLPVRLSAARGQASLDIRTSPLVSNPGKVRLRLSRLGSEDLSGYFTAGTGVGFLIDALELQWKKTASGDVSGSGEGALSWIRFPIPTPGSPIPEALLRDVKLKFVVLQGAIRISSLTGTYEGSDVDGTGEISRFLTPSLSTVNFHLRVRNPLEGKMAAMFDMVAKNSKNANLRVKGSLLSPTGEFQFF
jgi:type II secretion system protein N